MKEKSPSLKIMSYIKFIKRRFFNKIPFKVYFQNNNKKIKYIHLGSEYGGWTLIDDESLKDSVIISAGLGKDASFDIELFKKYNSFVYIIDPTPSAIEYYNSLCHASPIFKNMTKLLPYAIWNKNETVKFFLPPNNNHVSHSIINYQNSYKENTPYILVEAMNIKTLLSKMSLSRNNIPLVKLDIEGAEIEVLNNFLENDFIPLQILVEYDELNIVSKKGLRRVQAIHKLLENSGYLCIHTDYVANVLYVQKKYFNL